MELWSIMTTSSTCSAPSSRSKAPGASLGWPFALRSALYNTSSMSVDLPEPDTPVMHTSRRSGNSTSMFLRLCCVTPRSLMARCAGTMRALGSLSTAWAAGARGATCFAPDRYWPVSDCGLARTASGVSKATISPPRSPAPGPRSSKPVRRQHDLRIVLDHHQRIAGIAQPMHHLRHALHVARMQADRRLIQHEQRVHQRGAERGSQVDALDFAARQRARLAIEREIAEPHFAQVGKARAHLGQQQVRRLVERRGQLERLEERAALVERQQHEVVDVAGRRCATAARRA